MFVLITAEKSFQICQNTTRVGFLSKITILGVILENYVQNQQLFSNVLLKVEIGRRKSIQFSFKLK